MVWWLWKVFRVVLVMSAAGSILFLWMKLCGRGVDRKAGVGWKRGVSVVVLILLLIPLWIPLGGWCRETFLASQWSAVPMSQALERFWANPDMESLADQIPSGVGRSAGTGDKNAFADSGSHGAKDPGAPEMTASVPVTVLTGAFLTVLWAAGAAILLVRRWTLWYRWARCVKTQARPVTEADCVDLLRQEKARLKLKREVELLKGIDGLPPLVMGIFKGKILLPNVEMEEAELRLVLRHELTHLKHRDLIYKYFAGLAAALHWFNPLVGQFEKEVAAMCELSCDEALIRDWNGEQRAFYGRTILRLLNRERMGWKGSFAAISQDGLEMKRRLEGIMKRKKNDKRTAVLVLGMALVMCLCGTVLALALSPGGGTVAPTAALTAQEDLSWPLTGYRMTAQYGKRIHPLTGEEKIHDGIDLAPAYGDSGKLGTANAQNDESVGAGTPILAAADGVVKFSAADGEHGYRVIIDHGVLPDGTSLETSYSHCKELQVVKGQPVTRNTVIAYVGKTGNVTGNVLHFMVMENGRAMNPLDRLSEENGI